MPCGGPMLLLNAFSVNQLSDFPASVRFERIDVAEARGLASAGLDSAVGHASTAAVFSSLLGVPVPCRRRTIVLSAGDRALLGQYRGERLGEGATVLPENSVMDWFLVKVSGGDDA